MKSSRKVVGLGMCAIVLLGIALAQKAQPAQAPEQSQPRPNPVSTPTFRAESRLVVVDVVVTRHRLPVTGLGKSDFTILEDGKRQDILIFEPHVFAAAAPQQSLPPLPAHEYSNVLRQTPSSINIVLFDILNTPLTDQPYAREQMVQFLKTLPAGQPIALFELSSRLRMIAGLGTSSEDLIAAARKIAPHPSERLDTQEGRQEAEQEIAELRQGSRNQDFFDSMRDFLHEMTAARDLDRTKLTLQAFGELARAVSGYRGRKNVLWLSEEFPVYFGPSLNQDEARHGLYTFSDVQHEAATRLSAAEISLYPIDVRGLAVVLAGANSRSAGAPDAIQQLDRIHEAMDEVARETGGRAFYDTNGLKDAMRASIENGSTYYTLAYIPPHQNEDSKYHHIKVQLARSGLEAVYRKGYFAAPERRSSDLQAGQDLLDALQPATPESTMIRLKAQVLPPDAQHPKVRIHYEIDGSALAFSDGPGNRKNARLEFITLAWDHNLKAVANSSHTMELSLPPDKYEYVVHNGLGIYDELQLPPGAYNLCVGVMDDGSKKIGTLNVPLQVGDLKKAAAK